MQTGHTPQQPSHDHLLLLPAPHALTRLNMGWAESSQASSFVIVDTAQYTVYVQACLLSFHASTLALRDANLTSSDNHHHHVVSVFMFLRLLRSKRAAYVLRASTVRDRRKNEWKCLQPTNQPWEGWWGLEVGAFKGLAETPAGRGSVDQNGNRAVVGDGLKGEGLAVHPVVACELPHLTPVASHGLPVRGGTLHVQLLYITGPSHIGHENQEKVRVSVDGEPHASRLHTRHSVSKKKNHTSVSLSRKPQHHHPPKRHSNNILEDTRQKMQRFVIGEG